MQFEIIPRAEADVVSLMKSIDKVVINPLIFFLFALAMLYFLYGVAQYLLSPNNEEVRQTSKSHMLWGIVGLFIMVAVFGILNFITSSLGINNVKIQSNGNYSVTSQNGTTTSVDQPGLTIKQLPQPNAPTPAESDTSGGNTSVTLANQDPNLKPMQSPFPDYVENSLCWHKVIHSSGSSEYNANNPTYGDLTLTLHDVARKEYIADTGQSTSVNQNLPVIYDSVTLYNKADKQYYAWVDARAPRNATGASVNCSNLQMSPTQSSDNYTYLDKYKTSTTNISTAVQTSTVDPTLSPFPDYDPSPLCWNREFSLTGSTEYQATQNVKYNNIAYPTLSGYLRARFLSETSQSDAKVAKNLPLMYDYQPLYNAADKLYYVWIDVRAPIGTGTTADCNLKISINQSTGNYKLTGKYQSSDINISAGQVAKTLDFTKSPFPAYILNPTACWRKEMLFKDKTEYKALEAVDPAARSTYLNETHQLETKANQSYPIKYGVQTAFNSADQMYYVWVDERAPIGTASTQSCNLPLQATLPQPQNESTKTSSLIGSVQSDASYYRVVDSGVSPSLSQARAIAINNALIQIGLLKGVNDLTGIVYRVIPPEKYYPLDATGNYDYFVAVESPK